MKTALGGPKRAQVFSLYTKQTKVSTAGLGTNIVYSVLLDVYKSRLSLYLEYKLCMTIQNIQLSNNWYRCPILQMRGRQLSIYGQFKSLLGPKWTLECVRHELCIRGVHSNNLDWKRFHLFCFMSCYWCCSISMFLERKHLKKWDILVLGIYKHESSFVLLRDENSFSRPLLS